MAAKSAPPGLRQKFILVSSFIMMFVLVFQLLYFISIRTVTRQMINQYTADMTTQAVNNIGAILNGIRQTVTHFSYGPLVDRLMEPANEYDLYNIWNFQDNMVRTVAATNRDIYDIVFFRTDGHVRYQYNHSDMQVRRLLDQHEPRLLSPGGPEGFICLSDGTGTVKISGYIQRIRHTATPARYGNTVGACMAMLDPGILSRIVREIPTIGKSEFFLFDQNNLLIGSSRAAVHGESAVPAPPGMIRREIGDTGWYLAVKMDADSLFGNYRFSQSFSLLVTVFILALLGFQIKILNANIVAPVSRLHEEIKNVITSRFQERIVMPGRGEINGIAQAINLMLDHHAKIADQILRTRQSLWDIRIEAAQNEITALENQVNPHFLMNTLQCICGIAVAHQVPLIVEVTSCLRDIFEYSLHGEEDATLGDEAACLRQYLSIIDIRFDRAFDWSIDIPEELLAQSMGKMILQPLAENAIYHGLEKKGSGRLLITGRREGETVTIRIEDDGAGIEEDRLTRLQGMLADREAIRRESIEHKRIGIANTCQRLKMMFGDQYGLDIQSVLNQGACVEIHIPYCPRPVPKEPVPV